MAQLPAGSLWRLAIWSLAGGGLLLLDWLATKRGLGGLQAAKFTDPRCSLTVQLTQLFLRLWTPLQQEQQNIISKWQLRDTRSKVIATETHSRSLERSLQKPAGFPFRSHISTIPIRRSLHIISSRQFKIQRTASEAPLLLVLKYQVPRSQSVKIHVPKNHLHMN